MILKHELRSNRKSLLIWIACIAGFDFCMLLFYPGLQDSLAEINKSYANMGAFATAFGMDQLSIGTPVGFYGTYVGAMLSLCGAIYAAILGCGMISKEEGGHTAEYLYTLPYRRVHVVLQKVFAVILMIFVFDLVNTLAGVLGLQIIDAEYSIAGILLYHVGQFFLHLEVAAIGILISACTKKTNLGIGLGVALILYFMDMMGRILEQLEFCKYISPFYYANAVKILPEEKIDQPLLWLGILITATSIAIGTLIYNKRDLAS